MGLLDAWSSAGPSPDRFVGKECSRVAIGRFEVQFHFPDAGVISVEGHWDLRDDSGEVVDRSRDHDGRACCLIHKVLDSPVRRHAVDAPKSFTLWFANGYALTIFDDSESHESFSIQPDGPFI